MRATGTFTTAFEPLASDDEWLGHARILKTIEGDLVGTGRAEMLSAGTDVEGSAGYVAIDRITGVLHGRKGSFVLQHSGLMGRGEQELSVRIVPDSGTGEFTGISGKLRIDIVEGQHLYELDCSLP